MWIAILFWILHYDKYVQDIDKVIGNYIFIVYFFSSLILRLIRLISYSNILVVPYIKSTSYLQKKNLSYI